MVSKAYKLAILSLFAMISLFVYSSNDVVSANSVESNMNNEVSNVIQKNIQVIKHMNGTVEVYVKNKNEVANKLVENGYS